MVSPKELERQGFSKTFKGYNVEEVDNYVEDLLDEYKKLFDEYNALAKTLAETREELEIATNEEKAVSVTLQRAQDSAQETISKAEAEAEAIIAKANETAEEIKGAVNEGCDRILDVYLSKVTAEREKLVKCEDAVNKFKDDLYEAYRKHISMIDSIMPDTDLTPYLSDEELESKALEFANEKISPETKAEMKKSN